MCTRMFNYYVGLDLGQSRDYTALAVLEEPVWVPDDHDVRQSVGLHNTERSGWVSPADMTPYLATQALSLGYHYGRPPNPPLYLRHLERFDLGTRYTAVVKRVSDLLRSGPLAARRTKLLVDKTGVGAAVVDSFAQAGVPMAAVTIHGGSEVSTEPDGYRVPKKDLVAATQSLFQGERLKIAEALELAPVLREELMNFRAKINPDTAHASFEHWREGQHDDLVLAAALACWYREWVNRSAEFRNLGGGDYVAPTTRDEYTKN